MNRGSHIEPTARGGADHASMRPRFMNRGSTRAFPRFVPMDVSASMRPRFMNRGSSGGARRLGSRATGFNEAPIHESGKCPHSPTSRSGPHCFNEAPIHESGKCVEVNDLVRINVASMRPRFMNRGSKVDNAVEELSRIASMRPRFMNRGSGTINGKHCGFECMLQ